MDWALVERPVHELELLLPGLEVVGVELRAAAAARDHDVEFRGLKVPDVVAREPRDVDARLAHDLDGAGLDGRAADDARARDADLGVAPQLPQPAVGHLAPAAVVITQEHDVRLVLRAVGDLLRGGLAHFLPTAV